MVLKIFRVSEIVGMRVFTDGGDFLGTVEEANIVGNKIDGWRVKIAKNSNLTVLLSGARGLIIPHQYIKAFGEVIVINKAAVPSREEKEEEFPEE